MTNPASQQAAPATPPAQPAAPAAEQTPATPAAPVTPEASATPEPPAGGAKGEPSREQQMQRIVSDAVAPLLEQIKALQDAAKPVEPAADDPKPEETNAEAEQLRAQLANLTKTHTLETELLRAGCADTVAALAHIKLDAVKIGEDGTLEGFDLDKFKEEHALLFPSSPTVVSTGAAPAGAPPAQTQATSIADALHMLNKE